MRDFKQLLVWQRAHALSVVIHAACRRLPRTDFANLRSQLIRAAESLPTNVVEGCGASSQREFARFLDIAIKSTNETEYHLFAATDRGAISARESEPLLAETIEIRRMLFGLRKRVLAAAMSSG